MPPLVGERASISRRSGFAKREKRENPKRRSLKSPFPHSSIRAGQVYNARLIRQETPMAQISADRKKVGSRCVRGPVLTKTCREKVRSGKGTSRTKRATSKVQTAIPDRHGGGKPRRDPAAANNAGGVSGLRRSGNHQHSAQNRLFLTTLTDKGDENLTKKREKRAAAGITEPGRGTCKEG